MNVVVVARDILFDFQPLATRRFPAYLTDAGTLMGSEAVVFKMPLSSMAARLAKFCPWTQSNCVPSTSTLKPLITLMSPFQSPLCCMM
jgi:hypothetical protein